MNTRTTIEGPAVVEYAGYRYYTEGTITLTPVQAFRDVTSSIWGRVERRGTDKSFTVAFTPNGMLDKKAAYWPYSATQLGACVAPPTDADVTIWSLAGQKLILKAGVITQCPQLILATDKGPFGQMTITAMGTLDKAEAAADSLYIIQQAALASHTFDLSKILTPGYRARVLDGTTTVATFDAEEGFTFDPGMTLTARTVNAYGTVNFKMTDLQPSLTFRPYGPTDAESLSYLRMQGAGAAKLGAGTSVGKSLAVEPTSGTGITLLFYDFQIGESSLTYGFTDPRHGDWTINPVLKITGGAPTLFDVVFPTFAP
jgi:hypothetical protein